MPAFVLLAFGLFAGAQASEPANDACAALIPPALATRLTADLPAYALPGSQQAGAARLTALAGSGDWPCPFVVAADFDGNGWLDRALLLPAKSGTGARLIGALNNQGQWQLSLSEEWPLALADSELRPLEAGLYQRGEAIDNPVAQFDHAVSMQTEFAGFRAGNIQGSYAIYALNTGRWQKLSMVP